MLSLGLTDKISRVVMELLEQRERKENKNISEWVDLGVNSCSVRQITTVHIYLAKQTKY